MSVAVGKAAEGDAQTGAEPFLSVTNATQGRSLLKVAKASHLCDAHPHCVQHAESPPCSLCPVPTFWHTASVKLEKLAGCRASKFVHINFFTL